MKTTKISFENEKDRDAFLVVAKQNDQRMTHKTCCVCGAGTKGVQHWNRDDGYGICTACVKEQRKILPAAEIQELYGKEGVNYPVIQ